MAKGVGAGRGLLGLGHSMCRGLEVGAKESKNQSKGGGEVGGVDLQMQLCPESNGGSGTGLSRSQMTF